MQGRDTRRRYIVAPIRGVTPRSGWVERLAALAGVTVTSSSSKRVHLMAAPEAIAALQDGFPASEFIIEEVVERDTQ